MKSLSGVSGAPTLGTTFRQATWLNVCRLNDVMMLESNPSHLRRLQTGVEPRLFRRDILAHLRNQYAKYLNSSLMDV